MIGVSIIDIGTICTIFATVPDIPTRKIHGHINQMRSTIWTSCRFPHGKLSPDKRERERELRELEGRQPSIFKGLLHRGHFKLTLRICRCLDRRRRLSGSIVNQTLYVGVLRKILTGHACACHDRA